MNKTKIEWTDYTWNPITGCRNLCNYCYAHRIAERFKGTKVFPRGFEPTFHPDRLIEPCQLQKKSRIFVCSMGEMFGPWVPVQWIMSILNVICHNYHTFQILTKFPDRAKFWNFPENVWLGTTVSTSNELTRINELKRSNARVKFVSFEPLLSGMQDECYGRGFVGLCNRLEGINWVIIGAQTNPLRIPRKEWIEAIVQACRRNGIKIFTKDNLFQRPRGYILHQRWQEKIQEFPNK